MKFKVWLARVLVVLAVVGIGGVIVASPAAAARADCPWGKVCTWKGWEYSGERYDYSAETPGTCRNIGAGWNDNIKSVYNRTATAVHFYRDANCTGLYLPPWPGTPLTVPAHSWDEFGSPALGDSDVSSFRWTNP